MPDAGLQSNADILVGAQVIGFQPANAYVPPSGWTLRDSQRSALEQIHRAFASGKKVVAVQGPTGSGKSLIGVVAALAEKDSYYLVPLKALQDQIAGDFQGTLNVFKGKSNYTCTQYPSAAHLKEYPESKGCYSVSKAPCQERGMSEQRKECRKNNVCPYYTAMDAAAKGPHALMNFSLYLAWMRLKEIMPERAPFVQRAIHVIDEAHRVEDFIRDHLTVELSTKRLMKFLRINQCELDDLDDDTIFKFLEHVVEVNNKELETLREIHGPNLHAVSTEIGSEKLEFHLSLEEKLQYYFKDPDNYIMEMMEKYNRGEMFKYIIVKPLFVGGYIGTHVVGERTLLLSATLPKRAVNQMGFKDEEIEYIDLPSPFPKQNRLIKFDTVGKINKQSQDRLIFPIAEKIEKVLRRFPNSKGIIHSPSYAMSQQIHAKLEDEFLPRILLQTQDEGSAKDILAQHIASPEPTVLFSPGMKEGIDLKNDLSRFQVIIKCPYPNLGDAAVKALCDKDHLWYITQTIIALTQQYGRSIRSADDYAETICLDSNIRVLMAKYESFIPKYVLEAVQW